LKIKSKNFIFADPDENLDELEAKLSQILHQQSIKESIKLHELHELHELHKLHGVDSPKLNEQKVTKKAGRPRKTKFKTKAITTQSDDDE
jgi:hypothetical protein